MDSRFPKYIRVIVQKLDFLGIPNLAMLIAGLAILAFIAKMGMGTPVQRFMFDPVLIAQGEWWRLFAFPTGVDQPIWLFFYVIYVYYVVNALEESWGPGPLTIFVGFSYLVAALGAYMTMRPVSIWYHVLQNVSLAFGTLFPDVTFHLFMILPVKAKWLALIAAGLLVFQFVAGGLSTKLFLLVVMSPYLLFFGPMLFEMVRSRKRVAANRKRFDSDIWK